MTEPVSDEVMRNRWLVIQGVRFAGVLMVLLGLLVSRGAVAVPAALAWVLLPVGLAGVFLAPTLLARRWKTPAE